MGGQNRLEKENEGEAIPSKNAVDEPEGNRPRDVEAKTRIKQCRGMSSGVYINGLIEDAPILFTVDTGASRTVISTKVYNKIMVEKQPILQKSYCLIGADGLPIQESGKGCFDVQLGTHEMSIEAVVADIEDEALLGFDVLEGGSQGAADILLSQNKIVLDGVEIPCFQVGLNEVAKRVAVADGVEVPGRAEALVDVCDDRSEGENYDTKTEFIVEPAKYSTESYNLMMASVLVDVNAATTCKARVLNPPSHTAIMIQDTEIVEAEKTAQVLTTIAKEETLDEKVNLNRIRRVGTTGKPTKQTFGLTVLFKTARPIVFVRKKAEAMRPCADYQTVNWLILEQRPFLAGPPTVKQWSGQWVGKSLAEVASPLSAKPGIKALKG